MKTKIISSILIFCTLVQIPLTQVGCTSFYPLGEDDNLSKHINSKKELLLKLKDQTEVYVLPDNYFYLDKPVEFIYGIGSQYNYENQRISVFEGFIEIDKIDSCKVIENNSILHHLFWLKDKRRLSFEEDKIIRAVPDSLKYTWLLVEYNKPKLIEISNSEISEVQVRKINWVTTSIASVLGIGLLVLFIVACIQYSGFVWVGKYEIVNFPSL